MAKNVPAKIEFLNGEIEGLRARMAEHANSVQRGKLGMLTDIRDDYKAAAEDEIKRRMVS
ncbi:hypothetical protein MRBLRC7O_000897 [Agrobacterium radiobacter]|uniref:hypothetical protein n=1 Tax=Agrobacterium radiobacter TaxID=362 RepID=UPI003466C1C7